jgi:cytochrome P450
MRALFYYSLKNQRIWQKLQTEIRANIEPGKAAPHTQARAIPYLEATVRETLRYHPPVSMTLERIVPQGGLVLPSDGSFVPAGSYVGMNPYIVGRNKDIFGPDADTFNPDRWLQQAGESDEELKDRMQRWRMADLTFGGGSRICLGRNLSLMEVYKVVATLIATFNIELEDPNEQWWYTSRWFWRTKGVVCKLKPRSG